MKQILIYILFSFFIIKSDAQVLKDFRITKCYYDSTDLYFEYEFTPLVDISVYKQTGFSAFNINDTKGIALIAEKYDSTLKKYVDIPFYADIDEIFDIEETPFTQLKAIQKYKNFVSMRLWPLLRNADIGGHYKLKLLQKIVNKEEQTSETFFMTLPNYDYKILFKFNRN